MQDFRSMWRNANAIDHATRTLNVEVDIDNRDNALLPGAYIFVHFTCLPVNTVRFPSECTLSAQKVSASVSFEMIAFSLFQ